MLVGIMSMQRIANNGSFLQSYSLKKNIEKMGSRVIFVDYEPGKVLVEKKSEPKEDLANEGVINVAKKILDKLTGRKRIKMNEYAEFWSWEGECLAFAREYLGMQKERQYKTKVDTLVIGSDEVFNCIQPNPEVGYARQLFGAENNANRVISYAASFGNTSLVGLGRAGIDKDVAGLLMKMDDISVRDKNSVSIVKTLTDIEPKYHVDPVFLYDFEDEISMLDTGNNYIVVYAYSNRISKEEAMAIKKFAKKYGKKIVCLAGVQDYIDGFVKTSPFETLAYVKNADFVITDTFHGSVFSIKLNKRFVTIVRDGEGQVYGNSNKLTDLLERFELQNRIVKDFDKLEDCMLQDLSFDVINEKILKEKDESLEYLRGYCCGDL